jgi:trehalose 6-phosphate phosphatase
MEIDERPFIPDLRKYAILLDVDGTIVDLAPLPGDVHVLGSLKNSLSRLIGQTGGALALVSGRSLGDLDRLFAPLRLAAVGGHGAEFRPSPGAASNNEDPFGLEPELRERLIAIAGGGVVAEDKGYSVALHYRLAPDREKFVRDAVAEASAGPWSAPIEILPGKFVVEVKHAGFNKATGVRKLMAHPPFAGRHPIFIGDDTTDESVFAIMPEFEGLAFSVGREVADVAGCFATPADVRAWLERIAPVRENACP